MIEALVGNSTAEKILLYIANYKEGYISGIAETFQIAKSQIRKQLIRLENGGILVARDKGNLRIYTFNPRCIYKNELISLLDKILSQLPRDEIEKYYRQRQRPRRTGKAL
jgi:DNA-binding IclR family transcriptional regulator